MQLSAIALENTFPSGSSRASTRIPGSMRLGSKNRSDAKRVSFVAQVAEVSMTNGKVEVWIVLSTVSPTGAGEPLATAAANATAKLGAPKARAISYAIARRRPA